MADNPASRVGVLTFHRCINYGSYWQARCLVDELRARGHDAALLDHRARAVNVAEWRCALQPGLPERAPLPDRARYAVKMLRFFRAFSRLPLSRRFPLDDPTRLEPFHTVVVGSDEVWNQWHPWYGRKPLFWGDGIPARKVSYAASFGNYPASEGLHPAWAGCLSAFDALSVRDDNSAELVQNATARKADIVLDPCLLSPPPPDPARPRIRQPYMAVYGHNFTAAFAGQAQRFARARGLALVSIGYRNRWADRQWLTAGPLDFPPFIAGAEAVATNFFHGCVFALRHGRPFAAESTPYRAIKVRDLAALVGAEERVLAEGAEATRYEAAWSEPPGPEVARRIADLRCRSLNYLDRALL